MASVHRLPPPRRPTPAERERAQAEFNAREREAMNAKLRASYASQDPAWQAKLREIDDFNRRMTGGRNARPAPAPKGKDGDR